MFLSGKLLSNLYKSDFVSRLISKTVYKTVRPWQDRRICKSFYGKTVRPWF